MNHNQNQGIQGFLTPTKLLSSFGRSSLKPKQANAFSRQHHQYDNQQRYNQKESHNLMIEDKQQTIENQKLLNQSLYNKSIEHSSLSRSRLYKNNNNPRKSQYLIDKHYNDHLSGESDEKYGSKKDRENERNFHSSRQKNSLKSSINSSYHTDEIQQNPQIFSLQTKQLIRKLRQIKKNLEYQLTNLQRLLDDTNLHLKEIDKQYEKIKKNILQFTSDYLDSAFNQYKSIMDWKRFLKFQSTGINLLTQINQTINDQQTQLNNTLSHQSRHYQFGPDQRNYQYQQSQRSKKIEIKIDNYNNIIKDISQVRKQCQQMRPLITQQRLRKFENALIEIGKF